MSCSWENLVKLLKALPSSECEWLNEDDVARRLRIGRDTLTAMLKDLPANLPGAPISIRGKGKAGKKVGPKRYLRRWRASSFDEWADSVRDWQIKQMDPKPMLVKPTRKPAKKPPKLRNSKKSDVVDWDKSVGDLLT